MYFELLKEWCDTLVALQVTGTGRKELDGGLLCPSCARIHGRCGDAIYPMMYLADRTGDRKYLECAKMLFRWAENMARPAGNYINDTNSDWKGITVFAAIQLGEALHYHGHLLDEETKAQWMQRFQTAEEYLYYNIEKIGGNINYPVTCAAAMAVAHEVLQEEKYARRARELAHRALNFISEDGLLFGEGKPQTGVSAKGCRPVDLGYNVEESLPGLVTYALLEQDDEVLQKVVSLMKIHLEFMLPDGAWDNSWGTRNFKWTYWGSRTSDGCQAGYGLLAPQYPEFAEAVYRNTLLLKECTHNGLLYGGPMYWSAGEPPCVHHTFCHAKALAIMLEHGIEPEGGHSLPREKSNGIRYFPSIHVSLLAKGKWRATVSDYDFDYVEQGHASGGALTMLWHESAGPVAAATMTRYTLAEPNNLQLPQYTEEICLTPRIETEKDGVFYRSINDKSAQVCCTDGEAIVVDIQGTLREAKQTGSDSYCLQYQISGSEFTVSGISGSEGARLYFPVISQTGERVEFLDERHVRILKKDAVLELSSDETLEIQRGSAREQEDSVCRVFNPVGGFEAIPFYIQMEKGKKCGLHLNITERS